MLLMANVIFVFCDFPR